MNEDVAAEVVGMSAELDPRSTRKSAAGRKVKSQSPALSSMSRDSSLENSPSHRFERDSVLLVTRCIEALNDIAPVMNGPKPTPFMYWPRHKDYICAISLIKRCPDLKDIAEKHHSSVTLMAKKWATLVRRRLTTSVRYKYGTLK